MSYLPLFLMLMSLPLGVAGQNIVLGIVFLMLGKSYAVRKKDGTLPSFPRQFLWPTVLAFLYVVTHLVAGWTNPGAPVGSKFAFGYAAWVLLPILVVWIVPWPTEQIWKRLQKTLCVVMVFWGMVSLSQYLWGWRLSGSEIVSSFQRARGLYSHPLTLAYVVLILYSVSLCYSVKHPRHRWAWLCVVGSGVCLFSSLSKAALIVAFLFTVVMILKELRGKWRFGLLALMLAGIVVVAVTDNPLQRRFQYAISGTYTSGDRLDDRIIFWQVAWDMIKERPVLGHGPEISTAYRTPYYQALGYGDLDKKYEAHNVFLQVWVTGGILSLGLFVGWLVWNGITGWALLPAWQGLAGVSTLIVWSVASLTQNSFQDSEVRFALVVATSFFWLASESRKNEIVA